MFKFVLDDSMTNHPLPSTNIQLYKDIYIEKVQYIQNLIVPSNCYIAPAGIYGQFLYYFLNTKEHIIGFLDNNTQRHTKLLYGTDKYVYSPNTIDYTNASILVCECPYKEEIISGLQKICNAIQIICV